MDPQLIVRAAEIAMAVGTPLMREIFDALSEGLDEQTATRRALERLAKAPDLTPVLPKVQAMIAAAHAAADKP
jgi:hypothetical protein